ncbi:hypothetical protein EXIGLDRAFT_766741 [Exidia glandulosa HHB12029]|uniref:Uncharacterized protein n=1 Tax=Exidia glandulosa HHB12029 TaxID=1314781 RepID=A0A165JHV4_EXIGL|nr:hypothetical protein EXIGLDRAFT_766741 [Exidia glandulosa HHB12029]
MNYAVQHSLRNIHLWSDAEVVSILNSCFSHIRKPGPSKPLAPDASFQDAHDWFEGVMHDALNSLGESPLSWVPVEQGNGDMLVAGLSNGLSALDIPLLVIVQPPSILTHDIWMELKLLRTVPDAGTTARPLTVAESLMAEVHSLCVENRSFFFALTSYDVWIFGVLDTDLTTCLVTPPLPPARAATALTAWAYSAHGGEGGLVPCRYAEFVLNEQKRQLLEKHVRESEQLRYLHLRAKSIVMRRHDPDSDQVQRRQWDELQQRQLNEINQLNAQFDVHRAQRVLDRLHPVNPSLGGLLPASPASTVPTYVSGSTDGSSMDTESTRTSESGLSPSTEEDDDVGSLYVMSPRDSASTSASLSSSTFPTPSATSPDFMCGDAGHTPASAGDAKEVDRALPLGTPSQSSSSIANVDLDSLFGDPVEAVQQHNEVPQFDAGTLDGFGLFHPNENARLEDLLNELGIPPFDFLSQAFAADAGLDDFSSANLQELMQSVEPSHPLGESVDEWNAQPEHKPSAPVYVASPPPVMSPPPPTSSTVHRVVSSHRPAKWQPLIFQTLVHPGSSSV